MKSVDKERANTDPLAYDLWPHDRQQLVDDLWALAVTHLPELPAYERRVSNESSTLIGRNLDPWKAIFAVALWLEEKGVKGLSGRMKKIGCDYQKERADFEDNDFTRLIARAICTVCAVCTVSPGAPRQ